MISVNPRLGKNRMKWFVRLIIEVLVIVIAGGVAVWFIIDYLGGC